MGHPILHPVHHGSDMQTIDRQEYTVPERLNMNNYALLIFVQVSNYIRVKYDYENHTGIIKVEVFPVHVLAYLDNNEDISLLVGTFQIKVQYPVIMDTRIFL